MKQVNVARSVTNTALVIGFVVGVGTINPNNTIPIPKSKNFDRMKDNLDVFDFEISKEDMKTLNEMPYLGGSGLDSDTVTLFG